ncbi:glycosylphosphatidylinositol anchor attachment 1 protein [Melanaphis sacchari]|uniref:GPI-anchor transamidase component GPAA1 n=1 Tax=Melanaphis sacchari TaxID=742174 RepID=A0A2H8TQ62_9HEMI|nr:glycosylphosphatidylinositol anchor attachment 1 protein [Melanaphis sacchari]XP_025204360.1 glycosylphosphatidylinositol anchor attachment 1 protein [Melanaphis sacchari]XP_025204361.1 glycosylphosphatidylinositol anchor attachment 1 protein [Melanaphis sacchari]
MGLLTDPSVGHGALTSIFVRHHNRFCILMYIVSGVLFCMLAHYSLNSQTYFSENALLPGLVKGQLNDNTGSSFRDHFRELNAEAKYYETETPHSYLISKFKNLRLETYSHNFTLNYPLKKNTKYTGRNVYGILRAPRSASIESIVLSVPYRAPSSVFPSTLPGLAVMFQIAQFFRQQIYWAKDIIFLVTEHEQLGMQAWLEAYHGASCGSLGVLDSGKLSGRAGAIQAAINLEIHSDKIDHIDIKLSGLNGQLPNLDLVNLAHRLCNKESVRHTFNNVDGGAIGRNKVNSYYTNLSTMLSMVMTQATGVPDGNHGLFHRFGIEAITLEGYEKEGRGIYSSVLQVGRVIEGMFRSLNNLLERFHQSFFFYLLPSTDRYVSIGLYMPCLVLLVGALFLKAFSTWIQHSSEHKPGDSSAQVTIPEHLNVGMVSVITLGSHVIGLLLLPNLAPAYFTHFWNHIPTHRALLMGYGSISLTIVCLLPIIMKKCLNSFKSSNWVLLHVICLLELGIGLLCVSMHNFSLGYLTALVYVLPAVCTKSMQNSIIVKFLWLLVHPMCSLFWITAYITYTAYPELPITDYLTKVLEASGQWMVLSTVDNMIYGNWAFTVGVLLLLPVWTAFWCLMFLPTVVSKKTKTE